MVDPRVIKQWEASDKYLTDKIIALQSQLAACWRALDRWEDYHSRKEYGSTHYEGCHEVHIGCDAVRLTAEARRMKE